MKSEVFDNVFEALFDDPAEAAALALASDLLDAVQDVIAGWGVTQNEAAERLGVTRAEVSDLKNGKLSRFALGRLMMIAARAGATTRITIDRPVRGIARRRNARSGLESVIHIIGPTPAMAGAKAAMKASAKKKKPPAPVKARGAGSKRESERAR